MRTLWPIERAVLDATTCDYPALATVIQQQVESALVTGFQNTGAGFFTTVVVATHVPPLVVASPLSGGHGIVDGVENGMGFVVFLGSGRISIIEGFSYGDCTTLIDFANVQFALEPWGSRR